MICKELVIFVHSSHKLIVPFQLYNYMVWKPMSTTLIFACIDVEQAGKAWRVSKDPQLEAPLGGLILHVLDHVGAGFPFYRSFVNR